MAAANKRQWSSGRGKPPPSSCYYRPKSVSKSPQSIMNVKEGPCSPHAQHGQQYFRTVMMGEQGKFGDSRFLLRQTPPPVDSPIASYFKSPQSGTDEKDEPCSAIVKHGHHYQPGIHQHKKSPQIMTMGKQGRDGQSGFPGRQTPPANCSTIASTGSPQSTTDEKDEPCSANTKHGQQYQSGGNQHRKSPQNMMMGKQCQDAHSGFLRRQTPPANCSPVASDGKSPQSSMDEKDEPCSTNVKHCQNYQSGMHQHKELPENMMTGKQGRDGHSGFPERQTPPANCSPVASTGSPQSTTDEKDEPCSANMKHGQQYQSGRQHDRKSPQNVMMGKQCRDGHSGFPGRQTPPANCSPIASTSSPQSTTDEKGESCSANTMHGQQYHSGGHQHRKSPQNMMMGEQGQDAHSGFLRRQAPPANYSPVASDGSEVDSINRKMVSHTCVTCIKDGLLSKCKADRNSPQGGQQHVHGSGNEIGNGGTKIEHDNCINPFDICPKRATGPVKLSPPLLKKNKEKRREAERNKLGLQLRELRSGMILLEDYLSLSEQVEIINECHKLGLGPGGFYQPGYSDGAKLHLHMMCLGKDWNPGTGAYGDRRATDGAVPPSIPDRFKVLVDRALKDSQNFINRRDVLPSMKPDICIVNFYTGTGKLGLHQDKDESKESLNAGLPVVSFSIGDSAEFSYGDERDVEKAEKVTLKSGDVLIFGGKSRHVFHGVPSISPGSAPQFIIDETSLRPGRVNLTFRQY